MVNEASESAQEKEHSATTTLSLSSAAAEEIHQRSFNRPLRWFKISKFTLDLLTFHHSFFTSLWCCLSSRFWLWPANGVDTIESAETRGVAKSRDVASCRFRNNFIIHPTSVSV
jgi:hypothetical protein